MWTFLADAVVILHFGFVLFVVFGGLLVAWRNWIAWTHIPTVVWGAWIEFAGWICPLTPLENWLRERGGGAGYESDFVERYVVSVLYPQALTRELQWLLGGLVIGINAAIYVFVWRGRHRRQGCRQPREE